MIELYQFRPKFGVPNLSPFCLKLETWLKMAELDYRSVIQDDPRKAPLGKLPYIKEGAREVHDSSCIVEYLSTTHQVGLDAHLSDEQAAIAHACQVMIEERLYWAVVYHRWLGEGWPEIKASVFSVLPPIMRQIIPMIVQAQIKRDLHGHGLGRHRVEQINLFAEQDLKALSALLGDNTYLMGDSVTSIDASLYAILCQILQSELTTPLKAIAEQFPNLIAYQIRMGKTYFPEYYQDNE